VWSVEHAQLASLESWQYLQGCPHAFRDAVQQHCPVESPPEDDAVARRVDIAVLLSSNCWHFGIPGKHRAQRIILL
jgi:hypothetical protein